MRRPPCGRPGCAARHCGGTSKRTGKPCGAHPGAGAVVCKHHGGAAGQVVAAARRRLAAELATAELARLGVAVETTPVEALQAMLDEAAGNVVVLRGLVAGLDPRPTIELLDDSAEDHEEGQPHGGWLRRRMTVDGQAVTVTSGIYGPDHLGDARPHVLVSMYNAERDRLSRLARDCAALGLDERRVRVAEASAERLLGAFRDAVDAVGLAPSVQEALRVALATELRRP